ncbi:MAG TPA: ATP-binding protein [Terracidiphilus sp.]|jgi:two-component system sensor histidine kinase CpxA|nr:ATP-binding protein [Terracidiphilus sp.]
MIRKSITFKILIWCIGSLVLCFAGFAIVAAIRIHRAESFISEYVTMQRDDAVQAYRNGGAAGLTRHIQRLQSYLPGHYYLADVRGNDVSGGRSLNDLLARVGRRPGSGQDYVVASSPDTGGYRFIILAPQESLWDFLPFYVLVLVAVGLLGWLLAVNIASPLRRMAQVVDQFGRGDLSARIQSRRRDEIGGVARAFDQMAERIEILLTAERRLLQDIAHELRTPLTRIGFAAALAVTAEDREVAEQTLTKEIARLSELVNGLLQVTRAEGDRAALDLKEISLRDLLADIVGDCQLEARQRGCEILLACGMGPAVKGNYELMRRAVENVLRNAVRYAPEGTPVEVKLDYELDATRISIRDFGPGVPEEALAKLFQPFFRVDASRDAATGGSGLGLSIAERAISLHCGSIGARNAGPGLLVTISLPTSECVRN